MILSDQFRSDLWPFRKFRSAVKFFSIGFTVTYIHRENFAATLSDYENCEKSPIRKDSLCKSVGRILGGPRKERHDQGGLFEALGSIYIREIAKKEKWRRILEENTRAWRTTVKRKGIL